MSIYIKKAKPVALSDIQEEYKPIVYHHRSYTIEDYKRACKSNTGIWDCCLRLGKIYKASDLAKDYEFYFWKVVYRYLMSCPEAVNRVESIRKQASLVYVGVKSKQFIFDNKTQIEPDWDWSSIQQKKKQIIAYFNVLENWIGIGVGKTVPAVGGIDLSVVFSEEWAPSNSLIRELFPGVVIQRDIDPHMPRIQEFGLNRGRPFHNNVNWCSWQDIRKITEFK